MNALVLDDEPHYRDHLKRALERTGLRIHVAASAEDAQDIVRELGVDLMIVDIRLSTGVDGLEFADWAKKRENNPALIVITGYGSPEHERRSRDLGAIAYLEKPFDLRDLELHVQHAIDHRRLLREIHRLEQELAFVSGGDFFSQTVSEMPLVCIGESGAVLHANSEGLAVLDAVVDPALPRPTQATDGDLLGRLRRAASFGTGWQPTTVFRRDAVLFHYQALVRPVESGQAKGLLVFFVDSGESGRAVDELWLGLLLKAAQRAQPGPSEE